MSDEVVDSTATTVDEEMAPPGQDLVPVDEASLTPEQRRFMEGRKPEDDAAIEAALLAGNFSQLDDVGRRFLIQKICEAQGVSLFLRPYAWGTVKGPDGVKKLVPIPTKSLYSQQRANSKVTLQPVDVHFDSEYGIFYVQMLALLPDGRYAQNIGIAGINAGGPTGTLKGDALADAMMTAWTKAENRVTASLLGGTSGPVDDVVAAGLLQSGGKAGETTEKGSQGPRVIDPNMGRLRFHKRRGEQEDVGGPQPGPIDAGSDPDLEGVDAEALPETATVEGGEPVVEEAAPAPPKEARPAPAPKRAPGAPAPAPRPAPSTIKPAGGPPAGGAPRPGVPRPSGGGATQTTSKISPVGQAPKTQPGAPKAPTPAPVRAKR